MKKALLILICLIIVSGCKEETEPVIKEPHTEATGQIIYPIGNTVDFLDWTITFQSSEKLSELPAEAKMIYDPAEDSFFYKVNFEVRNNSDEAKAFIPLEGEGIDVRLVPSDQYKEGYYQQVALEDMLDNSIGFVVPSGETAVISVVFHMENEVYKTSPSFDFIVNHLNAEGDVDNFLIFEEEKMEP